MNERNTLKFFGFVTLLALFLMFVTQGTLLAQDISIKGKVVNAATSEPVAGANINVKGTAIGTVTDIDGNYSLTAPSSATLVIASVGYTTQEVAVNGQTTIDISLAEDVTTVSEVVVTGYTTQRKKDITGAVGVVEVTQMKAIPTGNVTSQLQGRTSGVTVVGNGQPGQTSKLRIRGFSSFENNDPLYIVDGIPTQDISNLNPNDVESMSVLKDAGAASIYGSRASNGVVVVTTKKGQKGGVKVTYDMYVGIQAPGKGPTDQFLTAEEYAQLQWLVYKNDSLNGVKYDDDGDLIYEVHPLYGDNRNAEPTLPSWAANTDWYDVITDNAMIMNHDLSLSGGNENARFFGSFGYFGQDGVIKYTDLKKYTARFNSEFKFLNGKVKIGENVSTTFTTNHGVANLEEGSPIQMGPYRSQSIVPYIITEPISGTSHEFVPGEYGGTGIAPRLGNNTNAFANLERGHDNNNLNVNLAGSAFLDVEILKGLNFRSTVGGTYYNYYYYTFTMSTYENAENTATPSMNEGSGYGGSWVWTNALTFNRTFGNHNLAVIAGYEANKLGMGRDNSGSRAGYFSQAIDYRNLSNGQTITGANSSNYTPRTLVSIFAKADYSFMTKYIVSGTIRRDGSSVFTEDNRYGVFPSFSAAWRVGEEAFLDGADWLSDLKIRGSWGTMGNQLPVGTGNAYSFYGGSADQSFYDISGTYSSSAQGFRRLQLANTNAKWETNITTDIGFEAMLFNSKFGIVFDWYSKQTEDLLFAPEIVGTAGNASAPYINIASMSNKGIDLELTYKDNFGDLGLNLSAVFTTVKNEITKLSDDVDYFDYGSSRIGAYNRNEVGHSMSEFFGYEVDGLFQSNEDVANSATQAGAAPGLLKFKDVDGDGEITPDDRTYIGSPIPKFTYGLNIGLTYKNFDLSAFLYGSYGNEIFNNNTWWIDFWPSFQGQKSKKLLYDSWTPERTNTNVPKATNTSSFSTNAQSCSYYIENGSYARLKNLSLGYTIPASVLSKVHINGLRLYVQAINLFTITNYSGLDPELGGDDRAFGVDAGNYLNAKQFIFGLNLTL
ncbi:MAG: TonB-dependent receptor [Bacteroidales bacterium]